MSRNTWNLNEISGRTGVDIKIIKQYRKEDTHYFVNEDRDLTPIKIPLPECDDISKIDGFGLPAKEQKFTLQKYPQKLKRLEKDCGYNIETIWTRLNANQIFYRDEIKWIRKQWYYRLFGYWFFNNGKPTYLDPWHFFYLNYWELDIGLPEYRDRDRRWYLAQRFAYDDTFDFTNKDAEGNAIAEQDGTYKMYDTGRHICWGTTDEKFRRAGDTYKSLCAGFCEITTALVKNMGIQGEVGDTGKKNFSFVVHAWRKMPFFFQPAFDNPTNPQEKLNFTTPSQRGMTANVIGLDSGLESTITYATTSNRGFYDGKKLLWYVSDEDGKCIEEQIVTRWGVVRKSLSTGKIRQGFSIHPTTVGDMEDEGGKNFYELAHNQSNYYKRNENGETESGLYNFYFRATDGMEGFIDEYGMSMEEDAREYLQNTLNTLLKKNTAESLKKYREEKRLMPMHYADCWQTDSGDVGMPYEQIDKRISELMFDKTSTKLGNFVRYNNDPEGHVMWQDNPDGKFVISYEPPQQNTNQKYWVNGTYIPKDPKFIACADTFRLDNTQGGKMSDGGGSVFWDRDEAIDPDSKPIHQYITNTFVCDYLARPELEVYWEDMLMMCEYYGALMYPENNVSTVIDHFKRRGREGYLLYGWDATTNKQRNTAGFSSLHTSKASLFNEIINYLKFHIHREKHIDFLYDCKQIKGLKDMTNYDRFTARGGCLLGAKARYKEFKKPKNVVDGFNIKSAFAARRV